MATSLTSLRNELLPGLADIEDRIGQPIVAYQAFDRDVLVIRAGENTLEIARSEIEDRRHLPKLKSFLERLLEVKMCSKVAGGVGPPPPPPPDEFYQAMLTTKTAIADNLFLQELKDDPPKPAKPATPSWPPAPDLILDEPC